MNRIDQAFEKGKKNLLNIYFTAGFPALDDTVRIASELETAGADMIEIGLPFSDPLADGPTIQESSHKAIANGMTIDLLMKQLEKLRASVTLPVLLMGYLNPVLQYGFERFCEACQRVGVDGLILPDLPMFEYKSTYKPIMEKYGLHNIFLISPQTSETRIREIDEESKGFIYMVSSYSITGAKSSIDNTQTKYFERIQQMNLKRNLMIGFGISSRDTFEKACEYADGAIIGSAFIKLLQQDSSAGAIQTFINTIKAQ